jgi:hypothetical protein
MKQIKPFKGRQGEDNYQRKLQKFRDESKIKLFDIAACKCKEFLCKCNKIRRVPVEECTFLLDQRTTRKMVIGGIDKTITEHIHKKMIRQSKEAARRAKEATRTADSYSTEKSEDRQNINSSFDEQSSAESSGEEVVPVPTTPSTSTVESKVTPNRNRYELSVLARTCDRYAVSDRAAAAIASAVLEDVGVITNEDKTSVIDRSKLRRERHKKRKKLQHEQTLDVLRGLYFDGRKDKTLEQFKQGTKYHRKTIVEEHLSLVQEPGSKYIGHVTTKSGTALCIESAISKFLEENNIATSEVTAVGCDGTNVNTGKKGGVITMLENKIGRPLQWLVCQLHANELPLRHLLEHVDGPTSGPTAFCGAIGKALATCEQLPVVQFDKIEVEFPQVSSTDLSTDQQYLLQMCQAVSSGNCSIDLSMRNPGKMVHSRWLTTANRLLRLYIGTKNPSTNLQILTNFVMKVYAPSWFAIKMKPSCTEGARHLFKTVCMSRYLPEELKVVIDPVIQRNAYFGHPENILLAMLTDERKHIRELGLRRILKARTIVKLPKRTTKKRKSTKTTAIREFAIPKLNFEATDYVDLINWQECNITEPPLTKHISDEDLKFLVGSGEATPVLDFPQFPCHTQAVERCVKLVTEASAAVCGAPARDGFIRARLEARRIMPLFDTKRQYYVAKH